MEFEKHLNKTVRLFIDNNEQIKIICNQNISSLSGHQLSDIIEGSPTHNSYLSVLKADEVIGESMHNTKLKLEEVQNSVGFDKTLVDRLISEERPGTWMTNLTRSSSSTKNR